MQEQPLHIPVVISRNNHPISRKAINENALKVLYRLHHSGFQAYLVGGCVRDLMLGREPKDFDVATNAHPEEVRKIFRNCRLIGRRFRLAHVYFKHEIIEVATFRTSQDRESVDHLNYHGMVIHDNIYGTLDDDVWRRDFTVNALYYNIADFSVIDYTQGVDDIDKGIIRIIGDPFARYREDPVRMLRAVRFSTKLSFTIEKTTLAAIHELAPLIKFVSNARLFEETLKLFLRGHSSHTFTELRNCQLFKEIFPLTDECLNHKEFHLMTDVLIINTLNNTDARVLDNKSVNPAFLYAAFLWYPLQLKINALTCDDLKPFHVFDKACQEVISKQIQHTALPRRITNTVRDIWSLQHPLVARQGRKPLRLLQQSEFRAAYDFLIIRAIAEPSLIPAAKWWTQFINSSTSKQEKMLNELKRERIKKIEH